MINRSKSYLLYNADQNNEGSISSRLRKKRLDFFLGFCNSIDKPVRILDLGGSDYHWRNSVFMNNKDFHITIINTENQNTKDFRNLSFIKRDARDLDIFDDKEYEAVYSNSLLEHLNIYDDQKKMAEDIIRIGKHYFIQTPNYYFPVEPHFLFPFFQFIPDNLKTKLLLKYNLGWFGKQQDKEKARELASSIRLLKKKELQKMFPGGKIFKEKYFMFNKSYIVYN